VQNARFAGRVEHARSVWRLAAPWQNGRFALHLGAVNEYAQFLMGTAPGKSRQIFSGKSGAL